MTAAELAALARRLQRAENALADAEARLPGIRAEVSAIRSALTDAPDAS